MENIVFQLGRGVALAWWHFAMTLAWWYGHGLLMVLRWVGRSIHSWEESVGLGLWLRNLFTPMYGQTDWQGRIISFFMRIAILCGRCIQVFVGSVLVIVFAVLYVLFPPFALLMIVRAFLA
ncbi:MAG: hypothetical protein Q7S96_00300 [bacterium]|nr:hypothetical protein [bacterium]